jgi:N-acetylglucosaminyldiphosphoundecaprenol N-acetyl-beta-D-mannosaminyltransferase
MSIIRRVVQASTSVRVLGVRVDCIDMDGTLEWIAAAIEAGGPCRQVATVNPEFVMHARRDPEFAAILETSALATADGSGVLWAVRRAGCRPASKVTGSDLVPRLAELCAERGWRPFFLGAMPGVAEAAAGRLAARHPGFNVAGTLAGSPDASGDEAALRLIGESGAQLLLVAYGHPKQERWIARNRDRLPVAVAIGVGGAFDYAAGRVQRAPAWMRDAHLEWLYRLITQPWRARRMLALPAFVVATWRER